MQMYGNQHSFHEAAMIHAAHNGGGHSGHRQHQNMPPHHRNGGGGSQHHSSPFPGGHSGNRGQHHNNNHHQGGGFNMPHFVPPHMQHFMHQQHQHHAAQQHYFHQMQVQLQMQQQAAQQATAAKEVTLKAGGEDGEEHEAAQIDPSMVSPTKARITTSSNNGTPGATPSRHLNFSAMENTPVQQKRSSSAGGVNNGGAQYSSPSAIPTGGRTLPHMQTQQQQQAMMMMHQHHLMASGGGGSPVAGGSPNAGGMAMPQFTKRLERELHDGSKEDLVKLVMELCDLNNEVNSYVESKAQLFALRPALQECSSPYRYCASGGGGSPHSADTAVPYTVETPLKQSGAESIIGESADGKTAAGGITPQTPLDDLHRDLESRRCTSEERLFTNELHPCLRLYSNCRYPTSCFFRMCPRNLCLNFLRGECNSGKDCALVHRIPANASPQILHMVNVCRGEAVTIPDAVPSSRELFNPNASTCSDVANKTLDEEGHAKSSTTATSA